MENFFDVATPEEIREIYCENPTKEKIAYTKHLFESSEAGHDSNFAYLFRLYYFIRKDTEKAMYYLNKIQNKNYRENTYRACCCPDIIFD